MKITLVLRDITEKGGGERVCVNLANAFCDKYQVQIISFYRSEKNLSYPLNPKIQCVFLSEVGEKSGGKFKTFFKRIFYRYFLTFRAQRYLKNTQVVLANDRALAPIFKQKGTFYIRLWHLNFPRRKKRDLLFYDALVVLSSKELVRWKAIHPNIWVIPNFLPFDTLKITDWTKKNILSVGRMDRGDQKGFLRLIEIFAKIALKFPDWTLTIVGEGKLRDQLEEKIHAFHLQNQVILKPFSHHIQEEYFDASIYAMASYFEGFGMVLVESGICGLPSIAFDIASGPSDIIEDRKTGFLVKDGEFDVFALRLATLMQAESLRQEMGERAKEKIQREFLKEAILPKWEKLFSTLQSHNPVLPQ